MPGSLHNPQAGRHLPVRVHTPPRPTTHAHTGSWSSLSCRPKHSSKVHPARSAVAYAAGTSAFQRSFQHYQLWIARRRGHTRGGGSPSNYWDDNSPMTRRLSGAPDFARGMGGWCMETIRAAQSRGWGYTGVGQGWGGKGSRTPATRWSAVELTEAEAPAGEAGSCPLNCASCCAISASWASSSASREGNAASIVAAVRSASQL